MSAIKDIIDLTKDLESRIKERRDIDLLKQIHTLAFSLQSSQVEVMERDIRLMEENAKLKAKLAKSQSEEIRIEDGIEFRRGKRTNMNWKPFCPKCHLPAIIVDSEFPLDCSAQCGWCSAIHKPQLDRLITILTANHHMDFTVTTPVE